MFVRREPDHLAESTSVDLSHLNNLMGCMRKVLHAGNNEEAESSTTLRHQT